MMFTNNNLAKFIINSLEKWAIHDHCSFSLNCHWYSFRPSSTNWLDFIHPTLALLLSKKFSSEKSFQLLSEFPNWSDKEQMHWTMFIVALFKQKKTNKQKGRKDDKIKERKKHKKKAMKLSIDRKIMSYICAME